MATTETDTSWPSSTGPPPVLLRFDGAVLATPALLCQAVQIVRYHAADAAAAAAASSVTIDDGVNVDLDAAFTAPTATSTPIPVIVLVAALHRPGHPVDVLVELMQAAGMRSASPAPAASSTASSASASASPWKPPVAAEARPASPSPSAKALAFLSVIAQLERFHVQLVRAGCIALLPPGGAMPLRQAVMTAADRAEAQLYASFETMREILHAAHVVGELTPRSQAALVAHAAAWAATVLAGALEAAAAIAAYTETQTALRAGVPLTAGSAWEPLLVDMLHGRHQVLDLHAAARNDSHGDGDGHSGDGESVLPLLGSGDAGERYFRGVHAVLARQLTRLQRGRRRACYVCTAARETVVRQHRFTDAATNIAAAHVLAVPSKIEAPGVFPIVPDFLPPADGTLAIADIKTASDVLATLLGSAAGSVAAYAYGDHHGLAVATLPFAVVHSQPPRPPPSAAAGRASTAALAHGIQLTADGVRRHFQPDTAAAIPPALAAASGLMDPLALTVAHIIVGAARIRITRWRFVRLALSSLSATATPAAMTAAAPTTISTYTGTDITTSILSSAALARPTTWSLTCRRNIGVLDVRARGSGLDGGASFLTRTFACLARLAVRQDDAAPTRDAGRAPLLMATSPRCVSLAFLAHDGPAAAWDDAVDDAVCLDGAGSVSLAAAPSGSGPGLPPTPTPMAAAAAAYTAPLARLGTATWTPRRALFHVARDPPLTQPLVGALLAALRDAGVGVLMLGFTAGGGALGEDDDARETKENDEDAAGGTATPRGTLGIVVGDGQAPRAWRVITTWMASQQPTPSTTS
ncbi:hypothetical protein CXG81DRAFT_23141 [Caulochytrium protostelioides]|uniref:Uncharacterized protein n=1 Tax=Caulochytrium protostelioides TaxID=1555241 RepID=A0A4P9XF68_9FUNG|nr:hypothetical protein CXG81DRAFT_23141 [Caulochytrium protostelioides]|eukprot:RKP04188.1 hypothetical protein CXG81DRAFT_23141 [Caulochytrium protostelioides]